jgi:hypothetical protein
MVTVDFYEHSATTAIAETCRSDSLSEGGERGSFVATWVGVDGVQMCPLDNFNLL